jgi:hypothetical protein
MQVALKPENVAQLVFFIRAEKVMLDADLAQLYGFKRARWLQAVRRKFMRPAPGRWLQTWRGRRFPEDFVFELTSDEFAHLRSQTVISRSGTSSADWSPSLSLLLLEY